VERAGSITAVKKDFFIVCACTAMCVLTVSERGDIDSECSAASCFFCRGPRSKIVTRLLKGKVSRVFPFKWKNVRAVVFFI